MLTQAWVEGGEEAMHVIVPHQCSFIFYLYLHLVVSYIISTLWMQLHMLTSYPYKIGSNHHAFGGASRL